MGLTQPVSLHVEFIQKHPVAQPRWHIKLPLTVPSRELCFGHIKFKVTAAASSRQGIAGLGKARTSAGSLEAGVAVARPSALEAVTQTSWPRVPPGMCQH